MTPTTQATPHVSYARQRGFPPLVAISDGRSRFGWSRWRTYELAKAGKIELRKLGGRSFIVTDTALAFIESLPKVELSRAS